MCSVASGRLSFVHGLTGPCASLDTACSSSLVALHYAAMSLAKRECHCAITAGANALDEEANELTANAGMLSPFGRSHTFDQRADGYCRGEGCGAFLLSSGGSEGISILAVAVGQDGLSASLTAPNGSSQRRLVETVRCASRGCALEAHGTGTALGDPIEAFISSQRSRT